MKSKFWLLFISLCTFSCQVVRPKSAVESKSSINAKPIDKLISGKYLGYLMMKNRSDSLPFMIELISYRSTENIEKYRSVVKIHHGGYTSHEYTSEYFPHVDFHYNTSTINFKSHNQRFFLKDATLNRDLITGTFSSNPGIDDGIFLVERISQERNLLNSEKTIASNITGSYIGICDKKQKEIQLEVFRDFNKDQFQYNDWQLSGRIGYPKLSSCASDVKECQKEEFYNINYDFYSSTIQFTTQNTNETCKINGVGIKCDSCEYKKTEISHLPNIKESDSLRIYKRKEQINLSKQEADKNINFQDLAGTYYGFLHHEQNDNYQLVRLNVKTSEKESKQGPAWQFLDGHATTFFGEEKYNEFITYEFEPRRFVKSRPIFTFDGPGEIYIAINEIRNKSLSGIYYSKNFGRVGTIQFVKNRIPEIDPSSKVFPQLSGEYVYGGEKLQIIVESNKSEDAKDFYPLKVYGWAINNKQFNKKFVITSGVYDFYTSTLSLSLEDGRRVYGKFSRNSSKFYWPTNNPQKPQLLSHQLKPYTRKEIEEKSYVVESLRSHLMNTAIGKTFFLETKEKASE